MKATSWNTLVAAALTSSCFFLCLIHTGSMQSCAINLYSAFTPTFFLGITVTLLLTTPTKKKSANKCKLARPSGYSQLIEETRDNPKFSFQPCNQGDKESDYNVSLVMTAWISLLINCSQPFWKCIKYRFFNNWWYFFRLFISNFYFKTRFNNSFL